MDIAAAMVYNFFNERTKGMGLNNEILAKELHRPIIRNFKRRQVYSSFKDNIWGVDLVDMTLISKFDQGITYCITLKELHCVLLIYLVDILGLFL